MSLFYYKALQNRVNGNTDFLTNSAFGQATIAEFQAGPKAKNPTYKRNLVYVGNGYFRAKKMKGE